MLHNRAVLVVHNTCLYPQIYTTHPLFGVVSQCHLEGGGRRVSRMCYTCSRCCLPSVVGTTHELTSVTQ